MLVALSNLIASLSSPGRRPWLVALAAGLVFLVVSVRHLDTVPQVYEDEPWQASTAYKLLTSRVFGSDLFAGFYNMDQRYYGFMPLHPLLLAGFFRVLGAGLVQARLETVVFSLLTLVLTFTLGTRLFSAWVGAIAVVLLVLVRWTGLTYVQLTGIPLVDFARIARYDPMVPVLGLAALHVFLSARGPPGSIDHWWLYAVAGFLAGLAGLAHLYGLFWLPILIAMAAWDGRPRAAGWVVLGAVLPWLPYVAFVLQDVPDWRGQTLIYSTRFDLLNARWYVDNLVQEYHRYGPGLGPFGLAWLVRVGFWTSLVALPLSLAMLARRAIFHADVAARAIVVPALLLPVLFAGTIKLKLVNYTLIELPFFALAMAWGIRAMWLSRRNWTRPLIAILLTAVVLEGAVQLVHLELAAQTTTPYPTFIAAVRQDLPPGARILGLHTYWFGLQDFDYRSFLVPLNWADEGVALDEALARVAPDVVLVDARMRDYFNSPDVAADRARFFQWLEQHNGTVIGRIDDPTYGLMEVYLVQR
jgi:4-amino-4-deoxy-L-arabinose transferase-like glycosyltransferase